MLKNGKYRGKIRNCLFCSDAEASESVYIKERVKVLPVKCIHRGESLCTVQVKNPFVV